MNILLVTIILAMDGVVQGVYAACQTEPGVGGGGDVEVVQAGQHEPRQRPAEAHRQPLAPLHPLHVALAAVQQLRAGRVRL